MDKAELDALARKQAIDILERTSDVGGFGPAGLKSLKATMRKHIIEGGSLNQSYSITIHSLSNFAPTIRLTLSIELPKEDGRG